MGSHILTCSTLLGIINLFIVSTASLGSCLCGLPFFPSCLQLGRQARHHLCSVPCRYCSLGTLLLPNPPALPPPPACLCCCFCTWKRRTSVLFDIPTIWAPKQRYVREEARLINEMELSFLFSFRRTMLSIFDNDAVLCLNYIYSHLIS